MLLLRCLARRPLALAKLPPIEVSPQTRARILSHAERPQTPVTLGSMMDLSATPEAWIRAASFLRGELPIRLAHRIYQLEHLPFGLSLMPSVHEIKRQYIESFDTAYHAVTPDSPETEAAFTAQLREIFSRHSHLLMLLGRGLLELKGHGQIFDVNTSEGPGSIQSHLDVFYSERIALRTMIQHHIELHGKQRAGSVGVFRRETDPVEIAYSAIEVAKGVCMHAKGEAPDVRVVVGRHPRLTLPLIPDHLFYLLTELLKNSMRATIDTHGIDDPPPVSVVITAGDEDITIKVSDQGGGIPRSELPSIWSYLYTTAETDPIALIDDVADDKFQQRAPLAGFGCGLPISRCYARFFGGDLQILSLDGFGTDAFVHLPRDAAAREV